ncbi:MAG: type transport system permease protein [Micromonosporaceae bacterium]|jgi:ABC-2 type transport system permease protein|nr:type transport system permease protein [Micromonosporaceae bacterium]MDT5038940.1 type transport system permease protein [Micromonosporaceae bacterium]
MNRGFISLSRAMVLGFVRDRTALFFTILFPLMFLVLFGGLFKNQGVSKSKIIEMGQVAVLDNAPADVRADLGKVVDITKMDDPAKALDAVRKGEYVAAVEQRDSTVVVRYSAADAVRAGTVQRVLGSIVQQTNQALSGTPPRYTVTASQVEDKSLQTIQFVTPGLLGWAIATGATFGAALTLVTWRQKRILRRLRLSPVSTAAVVGARVGVSIGIALAQTAIFIGVALIPYFGLRLSDYWWMSIPIVIVGSLAFLSIGLLAGAWAKTPEAANGIAQLIVLPMAFLSGSFFPLDGAPKWLQTISQVFPLRHMNQAMLDVMVRGKGPASVLPQLGILAGFAIVVSLVAVRLFRWDDV